MTIRCQANFMSAPTLAASVRSAWLLPLLLLAVPAVAAEQTWQVELDGDGFVGHTSWRVGPGDLRLVVANHDPQPQRLEALGRGFEVPGAGPDGPAVSDAGRLPAPDAGAHEVVHVASDGSRHVGTLQVEERAGWTAWLQPAVLPWLLSSLLAAGLAVWILRLNAGRGANRVFALFLLADAALNGSNAWLAHDVLTGARPPASMQWLAPASHIATTLAAVAFLVHMRAKRLPLHARSHQADWLLAATAAILVSLALLRPELWRSAHGSGPLFLFSGLLYLAYAAVALGLALEAPQAAAGRRRPLLVAAVGFSFLPGYVAVSNLAYLAGGLVGPLDSWALAAFALAIASLVPLAALFAFLAVWHAHRHSGMSGDLARLAVALLLPAVAVAAVLAAARVGGPAAFVTWGVAFEGTWTIFHLLFVLYALVRHQLFDLDVRIRLTIQHTSVASVFAGAFFVTSELIEGLLPVDGLVFGVAAAGGVALALRPLQRGARRLAASVIPGAPPLEELDHTGALRLYEEQLDLAWEDGHLGHKEQRILEHLRERLGLHPEDVRVLERRHGGQRAASPAAVGA